MAKDGCKNCIVVVVFLLIVIGVLSLVLPRLKMKPRAPKGAAAQAFAKGASGAVSGAASGSESRSASASGPTA